MASDFIKCQPEKFEHAAKKNAAGDERAFLRNETGAVVRGLGRTAGGEVEQESALVTAVCYCIKLSSRTVQPKSLSADFLVFRHRANLVF